MDETGFDIAGKHEFKIKSVGMSCAKINGKAMACESKNPSFVSIGSSEPIVAHHWMDYDDLLNIMGADRSNPVLKALWLTLEARGFKIVMPDYNPNSINQ